MNNRQSIITQLQNGVVFKSTVSDKDKKNGFACVTVWRSKCRHYKVLFTGGKVERVGLVEAIDCIGLYSALPVLPVTPKTALQALYDALKVKINACYKALQLLPKVYTSWIKRTLEEDKVYTRLAGLLQYNSDLYRVKRKIEG